VYVSIEKHPLRADDLARAHAACREPLLAAALVRAWPPLTPGLHALSFDGGRVELLLGLGDIHDLLPTLVVDADAVYLDGFSPDRNPEMWDEHLFRTLARLSAPDATAATWSVASVVRDGLRRAGYVVTKAPGIGGKRETTRASFEPRVPPRRPAFRTGTAATRRVAVIGAGLAGAFAARALADEGLEVLVLERADGPAAAASGNPGGLFHGIFHPDDGPHARTHRAAALMAQAAYARALADGVPGRVDGLLRLEPAASDDELARRLAASGLPPDFVQAWPAARVQAQGGPAEPAWWYPGGGWISPPALVRWALDAPGITFQAGVEVASLRPREAGGWELLDADDRLAASVDAVVLAGGTDVPRLLAHTAAALPDAQALRPFAATRGQIGVLAPGTPGLRAPARPIAGGGYALTLPDGRVVFGATTHRDDACGTLRDEDHAHNLAQLDAVTGSTLGAMTESVPGAPAGGGAGTGASPDAALRAVARLKDESRLDGRVGWRATTLDRLPWIGAVPAAWTAPPDAHGPAARVPDQPRQWPRVPGLFVLGGLGSRGLTWGPLAGRLLASWVTDAPFPLEADLVAALDPARGPARASRPRFRPDVAPDGGPAIED
jgi:tRNA 5-methylaminomethyl-2-thiouridine biosynthesis bifunctional protein